MRLVSARSIELQNRSFSERVRLNRQLLENKYWAMPVDDEGYENYVPVGRGVKTSDLCGRHVSFHACKNVEAHRGVVIKGVDYTGKMVVRHKHLWCHKSSCPVCFIRGWSVRQARFIEGRVNEGVERGFGDVEHVVVSVDPKDYGLSEAALRKKARAVLVSCGVFGGTMIFHGYRMDRGRGVLSWGAHYHVLGFVDGGYDRCRKCKAGGKFVDCKNCDGVDGKLYKAYGESGFIVRVLEERKTVYGTAWYQMHHSTVRLGIKRFHVVTWFGSCGYNNFKRKSAVSVAETVCPVCRGEMVKVAYVGKRRISRNIGDSDYVPWFGVDVSEGCDWVDVVGSREGGSEHG